MSKRITVEQVVKAFEQTGLKPKQGDYYEIQEGKVTCACGLGAIYVANHKIETTIGPFPLAPIKINDYFNEKYGMDYRLGFARGFDGDYHNTSAIENKVEYTIGFEDGTAARKAVLDESKKGEFL